MIQLSHLRREQTQNWGTSTALCRKGEAVACHSVEKEHTFSVIKMKKAKHQVNLVSRKAQCHLKYSQRLSLISSTDGTWSPTLVQYKNAMWVTKCSWDDSIAELPRKTNQTNNIPPAPHNQKRQSIQELEWRNNDKVTKIKKKITTAVLYDRDVQ